MQLPKSTVSRRIAALEKRLGERLLQRTTRKLVITDFGQGVLDHARVLSEEVDAALAFALSRQARPSGRLRVSMPADFASVALEAPLAGFIRQYPEIALEIDLSPRRVDLIGENFDLAIRMGDLQDDVQLAARRHRGVHDRRLDASPGLLREHGEPLTPDALATMPGLMLLTRSGDALPWELSPRAPVALGQPAVAARGVDGPQAGVGKAVARIDGATPAPVPRVITPQRQARANSPELLIRLCAQRRGRGGCVGFLRRDSYVGARGELQRVLPGWCLPDSNAWAVFPGRRLMPAKTRAFIEMLQRSMTVCAEALSAGSQSAEPGRFRVG